MEQYEYKLLNIHNNKIEVALKEMGKFGWQLVAVEEGDPDTYKQLYFTRLVTTEAENTK